MALRRSRKRFESLFLENSDFILPKNKKLLQKSTAQTPTRKMRSMGNGFSILFYKFIKIFYNKIKGVQDEDKRSL